MAARLPPYGRNWLCLLWLPHLAALGIQLAFVLVIYCAVTNYPRTWWLKTQIYELTDSVDQESRHGLIVCVWLTVSHKAEVTGRLRPQSPPGATSGGPNSSSLRVGW